jgi:hypothetical protein
MGIRGKEGHSAVGREHVGGGGGGVGGVHGHGEEAHGGGHVAAEGGISGRERLWAAMTIGGEREERRLVIWGLWGGGDEAGRVPHACEVERRCVEDGRCTPCLPDGWVGLPVATCVGGRRCACRLCLVHKVDEDGLLVDDGIV